jgi:hypothetical protein
MKIERIVLLTLVLTLPQSFVAQAEVASIQVLSPTDRAQVEAGEEYPLTYKVTLGEGEDHFHVWVDDRRGPGVHDTKGVYTLPKLSPGEHVITIKVVDKGHVPTGPQKSIKVNAQ